MLIPCSCHYYPCGRDGETEALRGLILHAAQASPKAGSRGFELCRHCFPRPQFPSLALREVQRQGLSSLPGCFVLAAQCAFACMPGLCLCVAAAPPPVLSVRKVAAGAGGASLGLRRLRHVLDTGLSGLEPKHKGLGRRRNKGLFHAATEKLQISKCAVQAGGAGPATDPPRPGSAAQALGSTWPLEAC